MPRGKGVKQKKYGVIFNLGGLHKKIYEFLPSRDYWDKWGNEQGIENHSDGYHCCVFDTKEEARRVYKVLSYYIEDLKKRI